MLDLKNKTALITGGSKGIGFEIARSLSKAGANVVITSRNDIELQESAAQLGKNVIGIAADVRDYQQMQQLVDKVVEKFGSLDILLVNAGVGVFKSVDQMNPDEWNSVIETNLTGAFYTVRSAIEQLKKSKGYVFLISSLAGKNAFANGTAYNASKFGLNGFSGQPMITSTMG